MKSARVSGSAGFVRFANAAASSEYLTRDRERELVRRAAAGDERARELLATAHLRLVIKLAKGFTNYGHDLDELVSAGNEGLTEALCKVDPDMDNQFSTYATWWIKAKLMDYVQKNGTIVKIGNTKESKSAFFKAGKMKRELEAQGVGEREILERLSDSFGVEQQKMAAIIAGRSLTTSISTPVAGDEGTFTLGDTIADNGPTPEEAVADADEQDSNVRRLHNVLSILNDREGDIVRCRHLTDDPLTLEVLAEKYSVSRERIRQIEVKALQKVKSALLAA